MILENQKIKDCIIKNRKTTEYSGNIPLLTKIVIDELIKKISHLDKHNVVFRINNKPKEISWTADILVEKYKLIIMFMKKKII